MATPGGGVAFDVYTAIEEDIGSNEPPVIIPQETLLDAVTVRPTI